MTVCYLLAPLLWSMVKVKSGIVVGLWSSRHSTNMAESTTERLSAETASLQTSSLSSAHLSLSNDVRYPSGCAGGGLWSLSIPINWEQIFSTGWGRPETKHDIYSYQSEYIM